MFLAMSNARSNSIHLSDISDRQLQYNKWLDLLSIHQGPSFNLLYINLTRPAKYSTRDSCDTDLLTAKCEFHIYYFLDIRPDRDTSTLARAFRSAVVFTIKQVHVKSYHI